MCYKYIIISKLLIVNPWNMIWECHLLVNDILSPLKPASKANYADISKGDGQGWGNNISCKNMIKYLC